ncbi:MAG TPA: N-acetylmuramoyl-L-alanine amidase, partial [Anaerolineae bacterium]|nr:N-acetylmuramoyl-L-alanine amidase [Anaerolineae bacterium]
MTRDLTRRTFLQVVAACSASIATGCAAAPTPSIQPTRVPDLLRPYDLAGVLSALSETSLTVQSPSRTVTWPLASGFAAYSPTREPLNRTELSTGTEIGIWLDEWNQRITSIQVLPPLAGAHDFPNTVQQPAPTGETRQFGPLTLITRAGWGAAPPNLQAQAEHGLFDPVTNPEGWLTYSGSLTDTFNTVIVHHSALPFADGPRAIQQGHMGLKGYADIGYHFLIDGLGDLYEGRTLGTRGAHTGGHNTGTVGVVLLGNFNVIEPVAQAWQTLRSLIAYLHDDYHIDYV